VVRFRLPSLPPALSPEPETLLMTHALLFVSLARFAGDDIRFEHRMSTIEPLRVRSVVGLAYDEIRALIVDGPLGPGARLGQAELAERLGISRTSGREALRRLAGGRIVRVQVNPR